MTLETIVILVLVAAVAHLAYMVRKQGQRLADLEHEMGKEKLERLDSDIKLGQIGKKQNDNIVELRNVIECVQLQVNLEREQRLEHVQRLGVRIAAVAGPSGSLSHV